MVSIFISRIINHPFRGPSLCRSLDKSFSGPRSMDVPALEIFLRYCMNQREWYGRCMSDG